jgi:hypothetical protein
VARPLALNRFARVVGHTGTVQAQSNRALGAHSGRRGGWCPRLLWLGVLACVACGGEISDGTQDAERAAKGSRASARGADAGLPGDARADRDDPTKPATPGGDAGLTPEATHVSFACDADTLPPVAGLRRLTMTQYANSVRDLVAWALGDAKLSTQVMSELAPVLATVPSDVRESVPEDLHGSYRRLDQSLQQNHVDTLYSAGVAIGAALSAQGRLERAVGSCATDADANNDADCLTDFIQRFGARALRHPLEDDELEFYQSVYGTDPKADPAAYADLIGVLLNAPEFVYFVEHGADEVSDKAGVYELTAHELAARLSYQIVQTLPDDELLAAADDGSLLDAKTYAEQVDRLLHDPKARATLDEFFADWVKVEDLPALDAKNADPIFKTFAGDDLPSPELRQAMIDDVIAMLDYYTWQDPEALSTLFTTEASFAQDDALAAIYGVPAWDGKSDPPSFPSGQRPGLLTRALFLSTGSANTRPIMKGVFIRKRILCDDIPPPPPGANAKPPELRSDMTTREVVEELTQTPGTICSSCHATVINPLGFATENFDALGRLRSEQRLFDEDGKEIGQKPIDTATVPQVSTGDDTASAGAADLMSMIADSGKAEACLARNYFRFTHARWDDPDVDGCALEAARKALESGGTIVDLVKATTQTDQFHQRRFE